MARIAVTGGTGFVGANLVRRLLADAHEVVLLVRPEGTDRADRLRPNEVRVHADRVETTISVGERGDPEPELPPRWRLDDVLDDLHLTEVDLLDRNHVARILDMRRPDVVFHLAAHGAYPWQSVWQDIHATNVTGTMNVLVACQLAKVGRVVYTGTSSEYGARDHAPREDEAPTPKGPYALTKTYATLACQSAGHTTLRLYSVYGPWEDPRRFIPTLIEQGLDGRLPPLATPTTAHDFVYVDDVVDALVLAATSEPRAPGPGPIYNVGTGVQTTLAEAVEVARTELGITAEPQWSTLPDRSWDTPTWIADPHKIADELGWTATTSFADGFRRTVAWHRSRREEGSG